MKLRRILSTILALMMVIGCFAGISVSATEDGTMTEVYVKSDGGVDKSAANVGTESVPVQLHIAWQLLKKDEAATIYFLDDVACSPYTYSNYPTSTTKTYTYTGNATANAAEPEHTGTWTYTSKSGATGGLVLNAASIHLGGPVIFDDITVKAETAPARQKNSAGVYTLKTTTFGAVNIFCNANDTTFTDNFKVGKYVLDSFTAKTENSDYVPSNWETTTAKLNLNVGGDKTLAVTPTDGSVDVVVNAGEFNGVWATLNQKGGTITGDINLTLEEDVSVGGSMFNLGGMYKSGDGAYGTWKVDGDVNVTINGASIKDFRWSDQNQVKFGGIYTGDINVKITGLGRNISFGHGNNTSTDIYGEGEGKIDFKGSINFDFSDFTGDYYYGTVNSIKTNLVENEKYGNKVTVEELPYAVVGSQISTLASGLVPTDPEYNVRNIRFLIGVEDADALNGAEVSVDITALNVAETVKTFENITINNYYGSVTANVDGVNTTVTAESLGYEALMAVTIVGVPIMGVSAFNVQTTVTTSGGTIVSPVCNVGYSVS